MQRSCKVAVIQTGLACQGLSPHGSSSASPVMLLSLRNPTGSGRVGSGRVEGSWIYNPRLVSDPLGIDPLCIAPIKLATPLNGLLGLSVNWPRFREGLPQPPGMRTEEVFNFLHAFATNYGFKVVVIIGLGYSGFDISVEVANVAREVHIAARKNSNLKVGKTPEMENIFEHFKVSHVEPDGRVKFADGSSVFADIILYCTGFVSCPCKYNYTFPFLEINGIIVDDNQVGPLYKHVFSPRHGPYLSFVGITWATIIFLTSELQSKWIARVLSGKCMLPSEKEMKTSVKEMYDEMKEAGLPKHYTHRLYPDKMEKYLDWLAVETGLAPMERWLFEMYDRAFKVKISLGQGYRDKWKRMPHSSSS